MRLLSSDDSLAQTIGLVGYAVDGDGIGGVLKSRIQDFRVDEISTKISAERTIPNVREQCQSRSSVLATLHARVA